MPIAKLTIELEIPHAQSLKDRRRVLRSMKDKLRHSFNLSIAELDEGVVWNRATLGIASISSSTNYLTGQVHQIDQRGNTASQPHSVPKSSTLTPKSCPNSALLGRNHRKSNGIGSSR